jgi:hypothetical protein
VSIFRRLATPKFGSRGGFETTSSEDEDMRLSVGRAARAELEETGKIFDPESRDEIQYPKGENMKKIFDG